MSDYIDLTPDTLQSEHLCCAIADKKHQSGVEGKRAWLAWRLGEGHVFRKLDARGKVFIEYAPAETAWAPVEGEGFLYIYCLWVAGSFKGQGHGRALLESCLEDARRQGKRGVCALSSKKKKPFLADKKFFGKFGFEAVDSIGDYELLALSFDGSRPRFADAARAQKAEGEGLTIYYSPQCPYLLDCVEQIRAYCEAHGVPLALCAVDSLQKAKAVPCAFNNWATFYRGEFMGAQPLNEGALKKLLGA